MSIDALSDLKQRILSTIQLDGIEAAQSRYIENLPALLLLIAPAYASQPDGTPDDLLKTVLSDIGILNNDL